LANYLITGNYKTNNNHATTRTYKIILQKMIRILNISRNQSNYW